MMTRLRDERLLHEHLRDLQREAETAAFRATLRARLMEPAPQPTNEEAPWIRAALPSPSGRMRLALDG